MMNELQLFIERIMYLSLAGKVLGYAINNSEIVLLCNGPKY